MDETDSRLVERLNTRLARHRDEEVRLQDDLLSLQARLAESRGRQDALQVTIRDLDGTPVRDDRPPRLSNGMLVARSPNPPGAVHEDVPDDWEEGEVVAVGAVPDGRKATIRQLALKLARDCGGEFRVGDLHTLTQAHGFKSDHGGLHTSLKAMKEFEHSGPGRFRLVPDRVTSD
jgi:hypothetical protein